MCITVPITIHVNGHSISTIVLLDSGAAGKFMSHGFAQEHDISLIKFYSSLTVEAIDGRHLGTGRVSALTTELKMQTGLRHSEMIQFYILPTPVQAVILGLAWLRRLLSGAVTVIIPASQPNYQSP